MTLLPPLVNVGWFIKAWWWIRGKIYWELWPAALHLLQLTYWLISTYTCESFAEHSHHFIGCLANVFLDKIFETRQDVQFFFAINLFFCWNISLGRLCYPLIRKYLPLLSYRSRWCWILISELTRVRIHNPTRPQGTHYKALARVLHSITSLAICTPSVPF